MIKIYVGPRIAETKPFYVQQAVLESVSDYFTKALNPYTFREGAEGVLHFPEDCPKDWSLFLYWIFHRKLLHLENKVSRTYVRCWCMGNKYGVPGFQDQVMWYLLKRYDLCPPSLKSIKIAFENSPPHCKLRKLMTEEAVQQHRAGDFTPSQLSELEGTGFMEEFLTTMDSYRTSLTRVKDEIPVKKATSDLWAKYMVEPVSTLPFKWEDSAESGKET